MLRPVSAVCALFVFAGSPALGANAVHIGRDITVAAQQQVSSAVCFLCSVRVDGAAHGNLIVFAGNVYLNGPVHKDIVALGGNVTLTGKAAVGGSLVVFGGHLYRDPAATIGRGRVVVRPIVFLPIILILAIVIAGLIFLLRFLLPRDGSPYPPLPRF